MLIRRITLILVAFLLLVFQTDLTAEHYAQHKTIDATSVYLTVTPTVLVPGYAKEMPGSDFHNDEYNMSLGQSHIVVNLIDDQTGNSLRKAKVYARIVGDGIKSTNKKMELMFMDGAKSYGNYFAVPLQGAYKIELEIEYIGAKEPLTVAFDYAST